MSKLYSIEEIRELEGDEFSYPIMAADDEVVAAERAVPERVARGDEVDIVCGDVLQGIPSAVVYDVSVVGDGLEADGEKKKVGPERVCGSEAGDFNLMKNDAFNTEDAEAGAVVVQRRVSLLVYVNLQRFLHFQVAPTFAPR